VAAEAIASRAIRPHSIQMRPSLRRTPGIVAHEGRPLRVR